jgi:hypothetical protein
MPVIEQYAAPTVRRDGLAGLLRDVVVISRPRFWFPSFLAIHYVGQPGPRRHRHLHGAPRVRRRVGKCKAGRKGRLAPPSEGR